MLSAMGTPPREVLARSVAATAGVMLVVVSALAQGGAGQASCAVTENGEPASGSLVLQRDGTEVARGACGKPVTAPPGAYTAVIALDGALDGPTRSERITLEAGKTRELRADFETGVLEVRIEREGRRAAGMAIIRRDGAQIGTLGSGVAAHLSAGRYEVVVRYRADEKSFPDVVVSKGTPTKLEASF